MRKQFYLISCFVLCLIVAACGTVDVTKTAKGFHEPTDANEIEILMTKPDKKYEELGTLIASKFSTSETAKMHNALRVKAAPLGANAVIITGSGISEGYQYAMGVAIRYKSKDE